MNTQLEKPQSISNEPSRSGDDILIEEGERDFRYLMAVLVGAFGTFALVFLVGFVGDLLGYPYLLSGL